MKGTWRSIAGSVGPFAGAAATGINRRVRARAGSVGVARAIGGDRSGVRVGLIANHSDGIQSAVYPLVVNMVRSSEDGVEFKKEEEGEEWYVPSWKESWEAWERLESVSKNEPASGAILEESSWPRSL